MIKTYYVKMQVKIPDDEKGNLFPDQEIMNGIKTVLEDELTDVENQIDVYNDFEKLLTTETGGTNEL